MNADRWAEVERLFAAAAELEATAHADYVRSHASSAEVGQEVLSLLAAHRRSSVFDPLTARQDARDARSDPLAPGARVGAWEVVRELGTGGMGTVYLARRADGEFAQRAALKILAADLSGGDAEVRFATERQILAGLAHPHIAGVLDGGVSADGRPYFVMEHVEGVSLSVHCDARRLDVRARLRLFLTVCDAVQYAHQNLIVHRDLKPSNILVTREGVPTLLDFGIAKVLDARPFPGLSALTQPGVRVLTPEFAAPEQFHGLAITPASDVYQLGMLLHELLVGRRPVGGTPPWAGEMPESVSIPPAVRPSRVASRDGARDTPGETEAVVRRAAARRTTPDRLSRRLRGDLDAIVLKTLRPEPERRYATAGLLADDLKRHLAGRPVRARPDTLAYRGGKFVRRHAFGLAATAAAFLLVLGFALGMDRQARRTALERDRAEQVIGFLVGMFQSTDPAVAQGDTVTVREVLDRGAVRVRTELGGQPGVQATLLEVMGDVYSTLGLLDSAIGLLDEALALRRTAPGSDARQLTTTVRRLGMFQTQAGRFEVAAPLLDEALERLRQTGEPGTAEYAAALTDIGYAWQTQGRLDLAEPLLVEALAGYARLPDPPLGMGAALTNLGYAQISRGDLDSAEGFFRRSVDVRRRVAGENHPALATSLEALSDVLIRQRAFVAADSAVTEALGIFQRVLPEGHYRIAGLLTQRGRILRGQGRPAEAEPLFREALAMRIAAFGDGHFIVAAARNNLALALEAQGRDADAEPLFRAALDGYRRHFGAEHVNPAFVEQNLARLLLRTGARAEAEARFAHAIPIARAAFPASRATLGDVVSLGLLRCERRPTEALGALRDAVDELRPAEGGPAPDDYLRALNTLGNCLAQHGQSAEARRVLTTSLEASAGRVHDDPSRTFARQLLERLPPPRR